MASNAQSLSFEEFVRFLREWARIPQDVAIGPESLFEDDLGITGDDGVELLEAAQRRFGVRLASADGGYRETFHLAPNEVLFHGEGVGPTLAGLASLFGHKGVSYSVRAFRVGELFAAVLKASER